LRDSGVQKMMWLLPRKALRLMVSETRRFCFPTTEIHEFVWLKMRMELMQTTGALIVSTFQASSVGKGERPQ
jgi:hypothetical protein